MPSAEASAEAKRLYAEGKGEYAQGHYVEAIALFEQSYALSGAPGLLFNMAQAHRLAGEGHCDEAVALYKSYLAALPHAENRQEVEERLTALSICANEPAAAPLPLAPPADVSAPQLTPVPGPNAPDLSVAETRTASRRPPMLVTGLGTALLIAGGILYATALVKHREAERVCPCYPGTYAKWELLTNVSYAALAVGGVTLASGVSWWVFGAPASGNNPSRAALGVSYRFQLERF